MSKKDPRDMVGYGSKDKKIKWPNNARIAVQIVLNYEEGAENCVLNGDKIQRFFYLKLLAHNRLREDISIWSLFMNMVLVEDFGDYIKYLKKKKFQ